MIREVILILELSSTLVTFDVSILILFNSYSIRNDLQLSFRIDTVLFPLTTVWRIIPHFDKTESNIHSSARSN